MKKHEICVVIGFTAYLTTVLFGLFGIYDTNKMNNAILACVFIIVLATYLKIGDTNGK